jgi:nucleotide-binding universal stress UspA family protein
MKKILVPVDFSNMSSNALNYAAQLAKRAGAHIQLLHVGYAPITITTNSTFAPPSAEQLRRESLAALERLKRRTEKRYGEIAIGYDCISGFAVDEIPLYAQKNKYDLIVMGTQGAGFLSERLLGSTATAVMGHCGDGAFGDSRAGHRPQGPVPAGGAHHFRD